MTILVNPHLPSKIFQGITTEITGEGNSIAPVNDRMLAEEQAVFGHYQITPDWRSFQDYFKRLETQGMGINLASYVGATTVRRMVLGNEDRPPVREELAQMQALVLDARLACGPISSYSTRTRFRDLAPYENPNQLSVGMRFVIVNGVPVISEGKMTQALPGKVLRGPGYVQ